MTTPTTLDLTEVFVFLDDAGKAPRIPTGPDFWQDVMRGNTQNPGVKRLIEGDGWLVAVYAIDQDNAAWEMHPAGDELLAMLSGEMHLVLEQDGEDVVVELPAGRAYIIPRGTWHRQVVRRAGKYLGATWGKGTEHRPR